AAARALINRPSYLFADEPTGNLDRENADNLIELLLKLHETYGTTLVVATHDTEIAKKADSCLFSSVKIAYSAGAARQIFNSSPAFFSLHSPFGVI
ncbi:MAG: hypothetical protein GX827_03165, partial [Clostridiales bacterium]|nr:hypothetical protein [Clostridiales bacterium]